MTQITPPLCHSEVFSSSGMASHTTGRWSVAESSELYDVPHWGRGYFSIGEQGRVLVHPDKNTDRSVDLKRLVDDLQARGVELPVLIRFSGILKDRLKEIHDAFAKAISDYDYAGRYACVYPIKVNQMRQVVEQVLEYGHPYGFGLEAGSKAELLAVMALANDDIPIICNGFKDAEYIETVMLAHQVGRRIIPVVEKYSELKLIIDIAKRVGVRPQIGVRVKLSASGCGRWSTSGGYRAKFGLTPREVLDGLDELKRHSMADCFKLLHYHIGSQITNIRHVKAALIEAARTYADLVGRGAGLEYLDVGGGLGVDYDGSQTNYESSANYSLQEYANDVVYQIGAVCDDAKVPHPQIISESGRATVAYHSVLVFGVLGVVVQGQEAAPVDLADDLPQPLADLVHTYRHLTVRNLLEGFHDAQQLRETAINLFSTGHLPLDLRSAAEDVFWGICRKIQLMLAELDDVPEELRGLDRMLADIYFCNFSLFQSIPDCWAIRQLFPIMPIHRLDEQPTRNAVLGDITCDSDGKIDRFINRRDPQPTLKLHPFDGTPYLLGAFLVGAYQEILGDLHNLFGDTNAVHVGLSEQGHVLLEKVVMGDRVDDVLGYVQFTSTKLLDRMRTAVDVAVHQKRLSQRQAGHLLRFYEAGLRGYTYLQQPQEQQ